MRHPNLLLVLVLAAGACGRTSADVQPDQQQAPGPEGESGSGGSAGSGGASAGSTDFSGGVSGAGATPIGGSVAMGGAAGAGPTAGSNTGASDTVPPDPYAPRSGKFKMVVYSKNAAYRHAYSILTGQSMLNEITVEVGVDLPLVTEENTFLDHIDDYELVFFMNTSGDIFDDDEQAKFEAWMKKGGAFCGTHSAADTEFGWTFYQEVIGQNYEGHGLQNTADSILLEAPALDHPALSGLPNPWERHDEWMLFKQSARWAAKPGFTILARRASDQLPIIWQREHDNYRSFYTGIGHDGTVFMDPDVKKHLTGAIMWAVRREHCLVLPKPAGCP